MLSQRKQALVAEPGFIWSKSPSTVHTEFANRMAGGNHPDAVYRQLIAEIADHHTSGTITNRDAHRAANEAFGRLLMAKKRKKASPGLAPLPTGKHSLDDPDEVGTATAGGMPNPVNPYTGGALFGDAPDLTPKAARRKQALMAKKKRSRSQGGEWERDPLDNSGADSFLGHTPDHKIPQYLEHLRGKLNGENISQGELMDLQSLGENGYIHPDDQELHEAAGTSEEDFNRMQNHDWDSDPFDPREFGASRRKQAWSGWGPSVAPKRHKVAGWEWDEYLNAHIANSPRKFECSCGTPVNVPDYHRCKCGKVWNTYVIGTGGDRREASAEKFIAREVPERENVIIAKRHKAYGDYDKALNDWEAEEESMKEFPSNHVPKVNTEVKGKTAPDWHSRDHKTQRWVNKG